METDPVSETLYSVVFFRTSDDGQSHSDHMQYVWQNLCVVTRRNDCKRRFKLEIGFIDYFNLRLVTILNYSVVANLRTLQISTAHAKSYQSAVSSAVVS
jgi:hypothetical protein